MTTRHFTRQQLEELGVPFELGGDDTCATELSDELIGSERWTDVHRLVFRAPDTGDAYQVDYEVGSTEHQDGIDPWHRHGKTIPATEVEQRSVVTQQWLPVDAPADPGLNLVLPAWEAMYEPGNVSDYLIGYANDEAPAKAAAETWMRSQAEVTGRLEWVPDEQLATGRYDRWFELIERHDDGIDTGPGITVRRRVADEAQQDEAQGQDGEAEKLAKARRMAKAFSAPPVAPPEWDATKEWPMRHKRAGDRRVHATAPFSVNGIRRIWTACGKPVGEGGYPLSHMPVDCRDCQRATAPDADEPAAVSQPGKEG